MPLKNREKLVDNSPDCDRRSGVLPSKQYHLKPSQSLCLERGAARFDEWEPRVVNTPIECGTPQDVVRHSLERLQQRLHGALKSTVHPRLDSFFEIFSFELFLVDDTRVCDSREQNERKWIEAIPSRFLHEAFNDVYGLFGLTQPRWEDHLHCEKSVTSTRDPFSALTYRITTSYWDIFWRYIPATQSTVAVLSYTKPRAREAASAFWKLLDERKDMAAQPMLLALLTQTVMMPRTERWLDVRIGDVVAAMKKTGFAKDSKSSDTSKSNLKNVNYATLAAETSGAAVNLSTMNLWWQGYIDLAENIERETGQIMQRQFEDEDEDMEIVRQAETELKSMRDSVAILSQRAHRLLQRCESWHNKATTQLSALFALTSQQSNELSIALARETANLARESKKDSTSMKAIAAVTMVFLPGTFVASLFSMPVFDWEADTARHDERVVGQRFWVYWAVTVPLTLGTVAAYLGWIWTLNRQERRQGGMRRMENAKEKEKSASSFALI